VIAGSAFAGLLGVLVLPDAALLWMVVLGIGQGGALGLGLILPVLRGRDLRVREAVTRAFPRTVKARGSRVDSLEGWESGRAAADAAKLA
jgi:hypothetical protein